MFSLVSGTIFSFVSVLTRCVYTGEGAEGRNTTLGRMGVIVLCYRFIITFLHIHKDCLSRVAQLLFAHWPKSAR